MAQVFLTEKIPLILTQTEICELFILGGETLEDTYVSKNIPDTKPRSQDFLFSHLKREKPWG